MADVLVADKEENQNGNDEQRGDDVESAYSDRSSAGEGDDGNSEEDEKTGLLEQPLILEGQRNRKSIERLKLEETPRQTAKKPIIQQGTGLPLGEIEKIAHCIEVTRSENLKTLHRILYGRPGSRLQVKRNIRAFHGYGFGKGMAEYDRRLEALKKLPANSLKEMSKVLCVPSSGSKAELAEKVLEFLLKPSKERAIGRRSSVKKTKSEDDVVKGKKRKSTKKTVKKGEDKIEESDSENDEDEEEEEIVSRKLPKKSVSRAKKPVSPSKKSVSPRKESSSPSKKSVTSSKKASSSSKKTKSLSLKKKSSNSRKTPQSASRKKPEANDDTDDESGNESDDEPLVKKIKVEPSDEELSEVIEGLLKDANLEEVTMNKLCEQVCDAYPGIDLQSRRSFIKQVTKKVLGLLS